MLRGLSVHTPTHKPPPLQVILDIYLTDPLALLRKYFHKPENQVFRSAQGSEARCQK
jgi:hypothetical protein